jgi:hypothetical protein
MLWCLQDAKIDAKGGPDEAPRVRPRRQESPRRRRLLRVIASHRCRAGKVAGKAAGPRWVPASSRCFPLLRLPGPAPGAESLTAGDCRPRVPLACPCQSRGGGSAERVLEATVMRVGDSRDFAAPGRARKRAASGQPEVRSRERFRGRVVADRRAAADPHGRRDNSGSGEAQPFTGIRAGCYLPSGAPGCGSIRSS